MAAQHTLPALDQQGTQAAIYPSEDVLWVQGPPINDPGDQGVVVSAQTGPPPSPAREDEWIHQVINGETSNGAYGEEWVNVQQYGPTGFGPWVNETTFQTGHSQNIPSNPSSEQGWGVGPARRWAHFPIEDSPNPKRNEGQHLRNGELPWVTASSMLYYRTQLEWEQQWGIHKHRSPVAPVVPVANSVPYVQTVPTYSGGWVAYPGVDVPPFDPGGIY